METQDLAGNAYADTSSYYINTLTEPAYQTVSGSAGEALNDDNQRLVGTPASESFTGGTGNDLIDGGAGIDTAVFSLPRSNYTVATNFRGKAIDRDFNDSDLVRDNLGSDGTDRLIGIERLQFSDINLALDLDGHAGQAAKLLGAVFGPASVANKQFVGIALSLLDGGWEYEQLAAAAVGVTGKTSHADVAALLWTNLLGFAPTVEQAAPIAALLDNGMSVGHLTVLAADLSINTNNINLVGLSQTGIEFF